EEDVPLQRRLDRHVEVVEVGEGRGQRVQVRRQFGAEELERWVAVRAPQRAQLGVVGLVLAQDEDHVLDRRRIADGHGQPKPPRAMGSASRRGAPGAHTGAGVSVPGRALLAETAAVPAWNAASSGAGESTDNVPAIRSGFSLLPSVGPMLSPFALATTIAPSG